MLGSDFECFLTRNDHIIPGVDLGLPGKQDKPVVLEDDEGLAGYIHRDNVMIEICTIAAETSDQFAFNIERSLKAGVRWLEDQDDELGLSRLPVHTFNKRDMNTAEALEIGCDVDFVVADGIQIQRQQMNTSAMRTMRFSGGHVHISYKNELLPAWLAACMCDLFIGIPHAPDLNISRAKFYGDVSLHRETNYPDGSSGVEYRALDNFWIHNSVTRSSVALGAHKVERLLDLGDDDVLQEMYRLYRELPVKKLVAEHRILVESAEIVKQANALWDLTCRQQ